MSGCQGRVRANNGERRLILMAKLPYHSLELIWIGDSRDELTAFPIEAKKRLGFAIRQVQNGLTPDIAKPLSAFGAGVFELRANAQGDTFRVVYLIKLKNGIYILDAFKKKSKTGKKISLEDKARLEQRIKDAQRHDREQDKKE